MTYYKKHYLIGNQKKINYDAIKNYYVYAGSPEKVPEEYWEYRLVETHFRGNWRQYWAMPEYLIDMIIKFRSVENKSFKLLDKRREGENAR